MAKLLQIVLVGVAFGLSVGSAKRAARAPESKVLQRTPDKALHHPALQVVNRSPEVIRVAFEGPVRRLVIAPPRENARTLLAAGVYHLVVKRGDRVVRREKILLRKGQRYRLEVAP